MKTNQSTVLVTGANRGIGKAFVEGFLAQGARKIYAAARKRSDLDAIVALDPKRIVPLVLDVTKPEQVEAAAKVAADVNLLINNAGVATFGTATEISQADLKKDLEVNYFGLIQVTQAFVPVIEKNGGGGIANVLSVVSLVGFPSIAGYSASKAAAWSFTQSLRADVAKRHIKVFSIYPGPIDTDMAKDFPMDKTPPSHVAQEVIQGIEKGAEDIFPDPMSKQFYAAWKADHKAAEKQFAG
ncbi:SDR family oxidoreductase [Telmatocola sphagniphila]|uniref:SDR family oxidoreductase n=1 Tax=Telmatocola sphagniphila TaxID=1123043 RepID=A0A8E6B3Q6_9BACT|nr:SDR family oxidoreductase [Telmatocola sphagniphila]QVL31393.1 SDR family oxidoreductase [Telmatocola sphagniphila]